MIVEVVVLLLPVAAASGWWVARQSMRKQIHQNNATAFDQAYFRGLNYLVNEQPDKAIDVFVEMLEVNDETIEMHHALGNLFRRRGEVDRAIRIHQNIISRQGLTSEQRAQALLALGEDYMSAGLFDRAEALFEELLQGSLLRQASLQNLKLIYQHEKDWKKTLSASRELEQLGDNKQGRDQSHYLCELAEEALADDNWDEAEMLLGQALKAQDNALRPQMIRARICSARNQWQKAIDIYKQIGKNHPLFLREVLEQMKQCYIELNQADQWKDWLKSIYASRKTHALMMQLTEEKEQEEGADQAIAFLNHELASMPDLAGVERMIQLRMKQQGTTSSEFLITVQQLVDRLLKEQAPYQCYRCGFTTRHLHWQCPGCRFWGTMLPNDVNKKARK